MTEKTWTLFSVRKQLAAFGGISLPVLWLILLIAVLPQNNIKADISFPSEIPTTSDALTAIVNAVPGLEKAGITNFKATDNSATADLKIKDQQVSIVVFKPSGAAHTLLGIFTKDFKLTSFISIPSGSPVEGMAFNDIVFIMVPKGGAKNNLPIKDLPTIIADNIKNVTENVNLEEGLNFFGQMDISKASTIKKLLNDVGVNQGKLPLIGTLSEKLFSSGNNKSIKNEILEQLDFKTKLPTLKISELDKFLRVTSISRVRHLTTSRAFMLQFPVKLTYS